MIPTNLEAQTRSAHLEKLHGLVAFFEQQIGKSLEEPDHRDRENALFERIQTAQFGPRRKE